MYRHSPCISSQPANDIIHLLFMHSLLPAIFPEFFIRFLVFFGRVERLFQATMRLSNERNEWKDSWTCDDEVPADTWLKTQFRSTDDDDTDDGNYAFDVRLRRHLIIFSLIYRNWIRCVSCSCSENNNSCWTTRVWRVLFFVRWISLLPQHTSGYIVHRPSFSTYKNSEREKM